MEHTLHQFLFPALALFATGLLGVMFKRNLITIFMCVEFAFFVLAIAASEVAVGLAIITRLFALENTVSTKDLNTLGD